MKTIKVSEATNTQLNWLVAKGEGGDYSPVPTANGIGMEFPATNYTTDPAQMWPIIEREDIAIGHGNSQAHPDNRYEAVIIRLHPWATLAQGPTKLVAAARCYVMSRLGEEVEVPEEL